MAAIRASDPTTPEELLRAVSLLITLERLDLARTYLERLQALNLDAAAKAQLHERFGSGLMIRLSRYGAAVSAGWRVRHVGAAGSSPAGHRSAAVVAMGVSAR